MFNCTQWPVAFTKYCNSERDAFATSFKLIMQLIEPKSDPISADVCTTAAWNFIQYVNAEKQKVKPDLRRPHDPLWNVNQEQDASESINYFLNMMHMQMNHFFQQQQ